jgi:lipopolysaccharide transport system permease protein
MKKAILMNAYQTHSPTPVAMLGSFQRHRHLIWQMIRRDIAMRYRGSIMGVAWSFVTPILMLIVYTFVFAVVFKGRMGSGANESRVDFALNLFAGLTVFGFFSEVISHAPRQIVSNRNYVKRVVFPLEILSWVTLGSGLVRSMISLAILLLAQLIINQSLAWTVLLFPLVLLPLILVSLGITWFLAALGVYLRDIGQITEVFIRILMFMSAIFYPVSALPERIQPWLRLNPVLVTIEESRKVLLRGALPDWNWLGIAFVIGAAIAFGGFWWFQKTRKGFADVL